MRTAAAAAAEAVHAVEVARSALRLRVEARAAAALAADAAGCGVRLLAAVAAAAAAAAAVVDDRARDVARTARAAVARAVLLRRAVLARPRFVQRRATAATRAVAIGTATGTALPRRTRDCRSIVVVVVALRATTARRLAGGGIPIPSHAASAALHVVGRRPPRVGIPEDDGRQAAVPARLPVLPVVVLHIVVVAAAADGYVDRLALREEDGVRTQVEIPHAAAATAAAERPAARAAAADEEHAVDLHVHLRNERVDARPAEREHIAVRPRLGHRRLPGPRDGKGAFDRAGRVDPLLPLGVRARVSERGEVGRAPRRDLHVVDDHVRPHLIVGVPARNQAHLVVLRDARRELVAVRAEARNGHLVAAVEPTVRVVLELEADRLVRGHGGAQRA